MSEPLHLASKHPIKPERYLSSRCCTPLLNPSTHQSNTTKQPTHHISPLHHHQSKSTSLLTLPPEIRLQIYALLLPTSRTYIIGRDYGHSISYLKYPPLLQLNRQLRAETLPLFFGENTFIVDIHQLGDLRAFLKWVSVLDRRAAAETLGWMADLRITVGACLLVDAVLKTGRRK